ncbi:MAG: polyprenyl synthetase family protein [Pseudomonadota bacterium]
MDLMNRINRGLEKAIAHATSTTQPPTICAAVKHAVFSGGARIRPRLTLAVASACGDTNPEAADAAAVAFELMHCASLVHDDMPCFDNAGMRRGVPSIHAKFGEPIALLTGDALIVLAMETIARECALTPALTSPLIAIVSRAVGTPHGIVAGQAWEIEDDIPLTEYHRAKTASLFTGACAAGAVSAGHDPQKWMSVGAALGAAYQVADDLRDIAGTADEIGKPCGQDAANHKPNYAEQNGVEATLIRLKTLVGNAVDSVPECPGAPMLRQMIEGEAIRLVPKKLASFAA